MRRFKNELIDLDMQISPRFQGFLSALPTLEVPRCALQSDDLIIFPTPDFHTTKIRSALDNLLLTSVDTEFYRHRSGVTWSRKPT